jgi:NADH-quinone oxidoreductase subunit L
MSQLAYIFTGLGVALWFYNTDHHHAAMIAFGASMFHLFNHAMAKGMLFMASGSVIHEVHHAHDHIHQDNHQDHNFDPQDMRNMGGLAAKMPITATAMMFGSMSIIGVPLIGGFWSKEGIIAETWKAAIEYEPIMIIPAILILATAGMTGFYMSRMWFMTFAGEPKNDVVNHVHEATPWIREPLLILTVITAIGGFGLALFDIIHFLSADIDHLKMHGFVYTLEHAFLPSDMNTRLVGWTTILLSFIIGPIIAARIHGGKLQEGTKAIALISWLVSLSGKFGHQNVENISKSQFSEALQNRLYFDDAYEYVISKTVIPFANLSAWFDRTIIDGIIKQVESKSVSSSLQVRKITTGSARDYILMAAVGMISIFILIWGVS